MALTSEQFHDLFERIERLLAASDSAGIDEVKTIEADFDDISVTNFLATAVRLGKMPLSHKVLLIHGIRDDGAWFDQVKREFKDAALIEVSKGGYGYTHVKKFLYPGLREKVYQEIVQSLRSAQGHMTALSVICHSFGTYCVTRAIEENEDIRLFRLIMCGGIVPRTYRWERLANKFRNGRVLNECGLTDIWPIVAKRISKLFGDTGRFGFRRDPIHDRFHDVGHGDFFNVEFIRRYWLPFLSSGKIVESDVLPREPSFWGRLLAGRIA